MIFSGAKYAQSIEKSHQPNSTVVTKDPKVWRLNLSALFFNLLRHLKAANLGGLILIS
jgi:hypothetical protein